MTDHQIRPKGAMRLQRGAQPSREREPWASGWTVNFDDDFAISDANAKRGAARLRGRDAAVLSSNFR